MNRAFSSTIRPRVRQAQSLLEMALVLSVALAFLAMAAALSYHLVTESSAREEAESVVSLADSVRRIKKFDGYAGSESLMREVIELHLAPPTLYVDDVAITMTNSWGGQVFLTRQNGGEAFAITYEGLTPRTCSLMALYVRSSTLFSFGPGAAPANSGGGGSRLIATLTPQEIGDICESDVVHWSSGAP